MKPKKKQYLIPYKRQKTYKKFKLSNFTISGKILSHFKFDEKVLPGLKKQVVLKRNSWRNIFQLIRFIELWFTIFLRKMGWK